ncbi:dual specificity phosphatase domain protein (macronuclear) [Tetrahymena thermophila SB210]|uniref:Dual specificity phosphatase domain protein n=1 Tax=Tetrahymena thermophila (strain SB210) TaxID=312017 RepID=Q23YA6_TETTS|nr:dual specificity phosphatase domain protein [Tetrahymena thermophila SB210]EAS01558.2 dual specificity phosphatase domain protein [Tetrahymena thermophila SB210]|eukprot:XP_001021803.2 dual specificity phosphatase domain protein [Tetrahymena thermophila SB210]
MGSKISIDKYVSQLDDILQLNPKKLEQVNLESKIPESITQNIKIWRFYEEESKILNSAISLQNLQNSNFTFLSKECYVVLVVYRRSKDQDKNTFVSFPHSMWGIVESYNNLTPRGLEYPLSTSELNLEILDSFLLPNYKKEKISVNFEHMIFVWNGKTSNPLIKSLALSSAYDLESLIEKGRENILQIFFEGGVILKDKLKNGKVIQLNSTSNRPHNKELEQEISKMSQTIFLFKFLFPLNSFRGNTTPQVAGAGCQQQDNQMNQNNLNYIQNGQNQQNGQENNNQMNINSQNNFNSNSNGAENGTQQENEFQQDDVNQQQFYSSSSVDSNTTAASETHYLKFFKKQFCEQSSSFNYINNFIRIPPSSKKTGQSKKIQDAKLAGFDQINSNNSNEYQFIQQQQQFQPGMYQNQEQFMPQNGYAQPDDDFMQRQENNINYNLNGQEQNNYEGYQQSPPVIQNNAIPPFNNINNLMGKKGFKINLTNLNKNNNQAPNIINNNNNNSDCNGYNQNFNNHFQKTNQQVQQFEQEQNHNNIDGYQYGDPNQMGEEEELDNVQTVDIDWNIKHGNIDEDPQEKAQNFYKPNFGGENNQNNFVLNLPVQNDADNFHQNYGRDSGSEDQNSSNNNDSEEMQDQVPNNYNNSYGFKINNANAQLGQGQPLPSHRGSSGPNPTSSSIMAELMKKNQLPGIKLGKINGQNNFAESQIANHQKDENEWDNREEFYDESNFQAFLENEQDGVKIDTTKLIKIFAKICSEITPNFLYVSGEEVANNKQKLKQNGITHIINCAGDVCKNTFPEDFVYKTYRLKDAKTENIECIFYDTIKFIEDVSQQGGRVFIHCVQGISRSVTLCIAYKIWKEAGKLSFQDALKQVKEKRHVASPNQGFLVQLINFHKRLYAPYDSISVKPRVWCVCSHQVEEPQQIVAKMLLEGLYSSNKQDPKDPNNKLDPRGVFIIQAPEKMYIWVGNEIPPERQQIYQDYSLRYIENLRQYEHAPQELEIVKQGDESEEFWQMWFPQKPLNAYSQNREWNNWFLDITKSSDNYKQINYYDDDEDEDDKREGVYGQNNKQKPKLFIYPEKDPLNVFDLEDLMDDSLCILCKQQDDQIKIHIWRGSQFTQPDEVEKDYLDQIIQDHYPNHINNILLYKEILHQESEEFNECFYQN